MTGAVSSTRLSKEAELLRLWRSKPSAWLEQHIDIKPARYRAREHLEHFLSQEPPDRHVWCRRQLAAGKLTLDATRSYQAEFMDGMAAPGWYALKCANGVAKTSTAALIVHWFLDAYAPDSPGGTRVITTAGTWSQLQHQLWREIEVWAVQAKASFSSLGKVDKTKIEIAPNWVAIARAADKSSTFEGTHGDNVMIVADEAKAIRPSIFGAFRRIMRGSQAGKYWVVFVSSPGSPGGPFWEVTEGPMSHRVKTFSLSAYESERVSLETISQDVEDLGEDSPLFISMDLGQHPTEGEDTVIPLTWVQSAVHRQVEGPPPRVLGVDVARFGCAESVGMSMMGRRASIAFTHTGQDTGHTQIRNHEAHEMHDYQVIVVDDTGVGGAITDGLKRSSAFKGVKILPVNFGERSSVPEKYVNIKAEMVFTLRAEFDAGYRDPDNPLVGLEIPPDKKLQHQLASQRYQMDERQRYRIGKPTSSKDEEDKLAEAGKSPDRAHALVLANWGRADFVKRGMRGNGAAKINREDARHIGIAATLIKSGW